MLYLDGLLPLGLGPGLQAAVVGVCGVEAVPRQQRHQAVLALHPHRQPRDEAVLLPRMRSRREVPRAAEPEQLAELVDLGRRQPQLLGVELLEDGGWVCPPRGRDLGLV